MDVFLNIRIILPPSLFFASLLVAEFLGDPSLSITIKSLDAQQVAAYAGLIGGALLPLGFVFNGLTQLLLRCIIIRNDCFDSCLQNAAWERIFDRLRLSPRWGPKERDYRRWAAATYVRIKIAKNLFELIERRSAAINAYATAVIALSLSWVIAFYVLHIHMTCTWYLVAFLALGICLTMTIMLWKETMSLIEFLSHDFDDRKSSTAP